MTNEEVVSLYKSGKSMRDIEALGGPSKSAIQRLLREAGEKVRRRGPPKAIGDPLRHGRRDGKPTKRKLVAIGWVIGVGEYLW